MLACPDPSLSVYVSKALLRICKKTQKCTWQGLPVGNSVCVEYKLGAWDGRAAGMSLLHRELSKKPLRAFKKKTLTCCMRSIYFVCAVFEGYACFFVVVKYMLYQIYYLTTAGVQWQKGHAHYCPTFAIIHFQKSFIFPK